MLPEFDLSLLPGVWWDLRDLPEEVAGSEVSAEALVAELRREIAAGHRLNGVAVEAIAVRKHLKDTIFWLPTERQWANVHLTWSVETQPQWPRAELHAEWSDVVRDFH